MITALALLLARTDVVAGEGFPAVGGVVAGLAAALTGVARGRLGATGESEQGFTRRLELSAEAEGVLPRAGRHEEGGKGSRRGDSCILRSEPRRPIRILHQSPLKARNLVSLLNRTPERIDNGSLRFKPRSIRGDVLGGPLGDVLELGLLLEQGGVVARAQVLVDALQQVPRVGDGRGRAVDEQRLLDVRGDRRQDDVARLGGVALLIVGGGVGDRGIGRRVVGLAGGERLAGLEA